MGTRSTIKFYDIHGRNLINIYNQYDGYLTGIGSELLDFFNKKENLGNGFNDDVLLYICYKKNGKPYNTYITTERDEQEFNYIIQNTQEGLIFTIKQEVWNEDYQKFCIINLLEEGTMEEFRNLINNELIKENNNE